MAKIDQKNGKVAFYGEWEGANVKKGSLVSFKFSLPTTELGAKLYLESLIDHPFHIRIFVEDRKCEVGQCVREHSNTKRKGDSTITFTTSLQEFMLTKEDILSFEDCILRIIVTDLAPNEKGEYEEKDEQLSQI